MEQQLAAGLAERQIAEFVDDDDIVAQQRLGKPAAATGGLLLLELIDQIHQVEEPAACTAADDRRCHADTEVRFTRARATCRATPLMAGQGHDRMAGLADGRLGVARP